LKINKEFLSFLFASAIIIGLAIMPTFAYHSELYQWSDLNKTTPYLNEFMICYLRNSTNLIWDTYNGGFAQFFTPNASFTYDVYCCDNCRIDNNISIHLSPNSLHYLVDDDVTISANTVLEYAINDIIAEHRTIAVVGAEGGTLASRFDDFSYGDLISIDWIMIILIVSVLPLGAWIFTEQLNVTLLFFGISLAVGIFVAYGWELIGFLTMLLLEIMIFVIMWFIGKMIR